MKLLRKLLIMLLVFCLQTNASEFVVGPAGSAVFGPYSGDNLDLGSAFNPIVLKSDNADKDFLEKQSYAIDKSDNVVSCSYEKKAVEALNLQTGMNRLDMISGAVPSLDDPNMATPVISPDLSQSVNMFVASEALNASAMTANEFDIQKRNAVYKEMCNLAKLKNAINSDLQLLAQVCVVHQLIAHMTNLYADSDSLFQRAVEMNAVMNQAMTENVTREKAIETQRQRNTEINKDLKKVLDDLKKDREVQKKAVEDLKKAEENLKTAEAIPCVKKCDELTNECSEDCSARDAATEAAKLALAIAKDAKLRADTKVKESVKTLVTYLVDKMKMETTAILSILSGTIRGEANGKDVMFKVDGKDYSLIDSDKAIKDMSGGQTYHGHWGLYNKEKYGDNSPNFGGGVRISNPGDPQTPDQLEFMSKIVEGETNNYFNLLSSHLDSSKAGIERKPNIMGIPLDITSPALNGTASSSFSPEQVLLKFADMGASGIDNLSTIALAVGDYQANAGNRKLEQLQAMKTPQTRAAYIAKKVEETRALNRQIRTMIQNNLCYCQQTLSFYRKSFDSMSAMIDKNQKPDPFLKYIYDFDLQPFRKKLDEGYESKEDLDLILKDFESRMAAYFSRISKK